MFARDISLINTGEKKKRQAVSSVESFIDNNEEKKGSIFVLYGLARTGKTTIMEQIIEEYRNDHKCAFMKCQNRTQ